MLIDEGSDRILGFTAFGAEASELMATVQTAMLGNLPYTALRDALFTHPTAAEGLTLLLGQRDQRSLERTGPTTDERRRRGNRHRPDPRRLVSCQ